mmetsp:Transcript_78469/g.163016  ORF Transcript_78469/g.163016 Transcript_78469/m.163016 type:complete len:637 (+) Transcript_78469:97-2007(+)
MSSSEDGIARAGTLLERAGTTLASAGTNLSMMRANTLPTDPKELTLAATMPISYDMEAVRPCCCGLWKLQQFIGFVLGILCLVVLSIWQPVERYPTANYMMGITLLCGMFWIFEVMPIYMTSLMPLVLMPIFKVTSSHIAAEAYWNSIQMLVIGTYILDIALDKVELPKRVILWLLVKSNIHKPGVVLLTFMTTAWVLSMVCNNIAVTLIVTPFAVGLANAAEERIRDEEASRYTEAIEADSDSEFESAAADEVQQFAKGLLLGIAYASSAGGLATLTGTITNEVLYGIGPLQETVTYESWMLFAVPVSVMTFLLAYLVVYYRYVRGLEVAALSAEALESEYQELLEEKGSVSRDEVLTGCLQLLQFALLMLRPALAELFRTRYNQTLVGDPTVALIPAIMLFFIPSSVNKGEAILTWKVVHEKFDFGLLILIGGGFAISSGFVQSGLDQWLVLGRMMPQAHNYTLHMVVMTVLSFSTQVFSAVGTATTALPALYSTCVHCLVNPLRVVLPATVACSFSFALPTAAPANVVVLAKSQELGKTLRVRDFFCTGIPLGLLAVALGGSVAAVMQDLVFDAEAPFPKWACDEGVSCLWVNVSGIVSGRHVTEQACALDTTMVNCTLWNQTVLNAADLIKP